MILSRTPFRVSFVGGGSDLPFYFQKHGGAVISTTINKYMYITLHQRFDKGYRVCYSTTEDCESVDLIKHDIVRELIKKSGIVDSLEVTSIADIPAGSGLGSSSSYTVGLVSVLRAYNHKLALKNELAEIACDLEINILRKPIGRQDQYAASYGGLNLIEFKKNNQVSVSPIVMEKGRLKEMESRFLMFYTGEKRSADDILSEQASNLEKNQSYIDSTTKLVKLTYELFDQLNNNNINNIGNILDQGWQIKKSLANGITNDYVNSLYDRAMNAGADGGKLLGAGKSGFILLYANKKYHASIRNALKLRELVFSFENQGSSIIYNQN